MTLADFTAPGLILPRLGGADASAVILELGGALVREGRIPNLMPFCRIALNREMLGSTQIEEGMAFPHARLPGLARVSLAVGRSERNLDWGSDGAGRVRWVFLLAAPDNDGGQYLRLISGLARLTKTPGVAAQLRGAQEAGEILAALGRVEVRGESRPAPAPPLSPAPGRQPQAASERLVP